MKIEILKCSKCNTYSLNKACPECDSKCTSPKPAKFSIEDKWGHYRRIHKKQLQEIGSAEILSKIK